MKFFAGTHLDGFVKSVFAVAAVLLGAAMIISFAAKFTLLGFALVITLVFLMGWFSALDRIATPSDQE